MESITLFVETKEQKDLLCQLLQHIDFVKFKATQKNNEVTAHKKGSIFDSAGLWTDRAISQESLRQKAWKRN